MKYTKRRIRFFILSSSKEAPPTDTPSRVASLLIRGSIFKISENAGVKIKKIYLLLEVQTSESGCAWCAQSATSKLPCWRCTGFSSCAECCWRTFCWWPCGVPRWPAPCGPAQSPLCTGSGKDPLCVLCQWAPPVSDIYSNYVHSRLFDSIYLLYT